MTYPANMLNAGAVPTGTLLVVMCDCSVVETVVDSNACPGVTGDGSVPVSTLLLAPGHGNVVGPETHA